MTDPSHVDTSTIIAKVWLIGRAYAAAIERRKRHNDVLGDAFYVEKVGPKMASAGMDKWIADLSNAPQNDISAALRTHNMLTGLFEGITGLRKRSLASKYLHFHVPLRFFIFDDLAKTSARRLTRGLSLNNHPSEAVGVDADYADHFRRCEHLTLRINGLIGRTLSPREIDKVLLYYSAQASRRKHQGSLC
jgi:urease gamma subunit